MQANFNKIAWIYDFLSGLVFGKTIKRSQTDQLHFIPINSSILIIGGGTGWILEEISKIRTGLQITYIDSSSKMISLAKKRNVANNTITFLTSPIEVLKISGKYDIIITPFLFDMFSQKTCKSVIEKLKGNLKTNGLWLYIDFHIMDTSPVWQKTLLRLMYFFFHVSCHIEAKQLPEIKEYFSSYFVVMKKAYCRNFIISKVFRNEIL
jgi:ubiquinone/menaquinone biosynthesis C-methylase UbiE